MKGLFWVSKWWDLPDAFDALDEALDDAHDDALEDDLEDALDNALDDDLFSKASQWELAHIWAIILALSSEIGEFFAWITNSLTPLLYLSYKYRSTMWWSQTSQFEVWHKEFNLHQGCFVSIW